MTTFINLTPHALRIFASAEDETPTLEIAPSGAVARVATAAREIGRAEGVPLFVTEFGDVEGLPGPAPDTIYIVSGLVRAHPAVMHREDVYSPGRLLRDSDGRPIGAIGLTR